MWVFLPLWLLSVWMVATMKHLSSVTIQVMTQIKCKLKSWIPNLMLCTMKTTLSSAWWLCTERWANSKHFACNVSCPVWRHRCMFISVIHTFCTLTFHLSAPANHWAASACELKLHRLVPEMHVELLRLFSTAVLIGVSSFLMYLGCSFVCSTSSLNFCGPHNGRSVQLFCLGRFST